MSYTRGVLARVAAVVVVAVVAVGCSDDDSTVESTTTSTTATATRDVSLTPTTTETTDVSTTTAPAVPTTASSETTAVQAATGWERVVPGGDCQCSDASEFSFWLRKADPTKVVFFLQGGGACFSAETCGPESETFKRTTGRDDDPTGFDGVFDFDDERNPFTDYSFVFVPYCTGDVHLGTATTEYAPRVTVQHKGYVNGTAALEYLTATFPDASEIVVTGESAGSVPSPLYAGLVSDILPAARITVLADGSGAYPDVPGISELLGNLWGAADAIPDWPESRGRDGEALSFPGLFIQAGRHDPEIVFARHDYAFDQVQEFFAGLAGSSSENLVALIDANERQIEKAGVDLLSFIAPGGSHTVLRQPTFYTESVGGVALVDWVTDLVQGDAVTDVHCKRCRRSD